METQINSALVHAIETEANPEHVTRQFADLRGTGNERPKREIIEEFVGERNPPDKSPSRMLTANSASNARTLSKSPKISKSPKGERKNDDDTSSHDKSNSSAASNSSDVLPHHKDAVF